MGELVLDVGVLGPRLRAFDEGLVGVLVYGAALVGVLEEEPVEVSAEDEADAEAESSPRLAAFAAARVCLDGPMFVTLADRARGIVYAAVCLHCDSVLCSDCAAVMSSCHSG